MTEEERMGSGSGIVTTRQHDDGTFTVHGWRITGFVECPNCGDGCDLYEEIEEYEVHTGKITAWGLGHAECETCELAFVGGFESDFVIDLSHEEETDG